MEAIAREARRRTAAQRRAKGEKLTEDEEQEDEIKALREQNATNNAQAQGALDLGILASLFISLLTLSRAGTSSRTLPFFLLLSQIILLPLSFTPHRLGYLANTTKKYHPYVFRGQFAIFLVALQMLYSTKSWGLYDFARWSLPFVVSGAVEFQRKGEREMVVRLAGWEKAKYPYKGA